MNRFPERKARVEQLLLPARVHFQELDEKAANAPIDELVRLYKDSPRTWTLQLRTCGPLRRGGVNRNLISSTALTLEQLVEIRDRINDYLAQEEAS